ncbi:MAG: tRNA-dihydrouridine synthase family protein [Muribaculaceae bacterium]|nr:tRNA-dihydrouridine synthase family protein [Muribaculaceae bacterium]
MSDFKTNPLPVYIAPVQGHTDAAWRHFHHSTYGGDFRYYTPFIRCEHGELRRQDLRDLLSPLNDGIDLEPQVIFRDMTELDILLSRLKSEGMTRVNLNMGCPFPLQMGKGRGAGFLSNLDEASKLPDTLAKYPELSYSVKMRIGHDDNTEWRKIIEILNSLPLSEIAVHPRIGKQQYSGELDLEMLAELMKVSRHKIIYNGELKTPADMERVTADWPDAAGLMVARGILGRPSLASEYSEGEEWSPEKRKAAMMDFHDKLLTHYEETLCGDSQILSKIKPFWEYAEAEIGRKTWKAIKKSSTLAKYRTAINN